jgi:hypothetical protein
MKASFKLALKIFYYLAIAFTIVYWVYIVIDDWIFATDYWSVNWLDCLAVWTIYFLFYFLNFSFLYWISAFAIIFIYHKIILPLK